MRKPTAKLFLSEIDTHHEKPLAGGRLRAYILSQALFFDRLIVGDSQINNNFRLRGLLWDAEDYARVDSSPSDLWVLLKLGLLTPALRNGSSSLDILRREHQARGVANVPSPAYVEYVEEHLAGVREEYDIAKVSSLFKHRTLAALRDDGAVGRGRLSRDVRARVYDYVQNQPTLLYKTLRDWLDTQLSSGAMAPRAAQRIDRMVASAYRHNVAIAMRTNLDVPTPVGGSISPIDITLGDRRLVKRLREQRISSCGYDLPPTAVLSREFLSWMPASSLAAVLQLKSRSKVVRAMEAFRTGRVPDMPEFLAALEAYLFEVDYTVSSHLSAKQAVRYKDLQRRETARTKVNLIVESTLTAVQIAFPSVGMVAGIAQGLEIAHMGYAAPRDFRSPRALLLGGYMLGRSVECERLLLDVISGDGRAVA